MGEKNKVIRNAVSTGLLQRPENIGKPPSLDDYSYTIKLSVHEANAMQMLPRALGVGRDAESPGGNGVFVAFERALSDDELRALHDILARHTALLAAKTAAQASIDGQLTGAPSAVKQASTGEVDVEAERKLFEANVRGSNGGEAPQAKGSAGWQFERSPNVPHIMYYNQRVDDMWKGWIAARRTQAEGARDAAFVRWVKSHRKSWWQIWIREQNHAAIAATQSTAPK